MCVQICTVSDTLRTPSSPAAVLIYPAQRVQRPGVSCRCAVSCMVCPASGTACVAACRVQSVPVRWGWGLHPRGIQGAPGVGQVMPAIKFFKEKGVFGRSSRLYPPHPHKTKRLSLCKSPKIPKNTKRPLSRSNLCYT